VASAANERQHTRFSTNGLVDGAIIANREQDSPPMLVDRRQRVGHQVVQAMHFQVFFVAQRAES